MVLSRYRNVVQLSYLQSTDGANSYDYLGETPRMDTLTYTSVQELAGRFGPRLFSMAWKPNGAKTIHSFHQLSSFCL